jgi:hypothetical protein
MASIDIHASRTERHVQVGVNKYEDFIALSFRIGADAVTFYLTEDQFDGIADQIGGE